MNTQAHSSSSSSNNAARIQEVPYDLIWFFPLSLSHVTDFIYLLFFGSRKPFSFLFRICSRNKQPLFVKHFRFFFHYIAFFSTFSVGILIVVSVLDLKKKINCWTFVATGFFLGVCLPFLITRLIFHIRIHHLCLSFTFHFDLRWWLSFLLPPLRLYGFLQSMKLTESIVFGQSRTATKIATSTSSMSTHIQSLRKAHAGLIRASCDYWCGTTKVP